jgi:tight adherence protein C
VQQLLGLLILSSSLPLLWLALRQGGPGRDEATETGDPDKPVWADPAQRRAAEEALDLHDVMSQMRTVPRLMQTMAGTFGDRLRRFAPGSMHGKLQRSINMAGLQGRLSANVLLAAKFLTTILGLVLGVLCMATFDGKARWLLGVGFVAMGFFLVNILVDGRGSKRQHAIASRLPDVLDQISVCVEAGLGFDAAMLRTAKSVGGPLGEELGRTIQDIRLGASRATALNSLVERSSVPEVRLFARALIQAERSGIPIARVLRAQAEDARERRRQAAEEAAMKLPVKMLGPLMLCILPALFIVILGPAALTLMNSGLTGG